MSSESETYRGFNSLQFINNYLIKRSEIVSEEDGLDFTEVHDLFQENMESYKKCYIISQKFVNMLENDIGNNKSHPLYDQLFIYKLFNKDFLNYLDNFC
jgi:hypothetical protein